MLHSSKDEKLFQHIKSPFFGSLNLFFHDRYVIFHNCICCGLIFERFFSWVFSNFFFWSQFEYFLINSSSRSRWLLILVTISVIPSHMNQIIENIDCIISNLCIYEKQEEEKCFGEKSYSEARLEMKIVWRVITTLFFYWGVCTKSIQSMKIKYCNYCQVICHPTPFLEVVVCTSIWRQEDRRVPEKRRTDPTRATIAIEMSLSRVLLATTTFLRDRFQSILSVYWPQRKKRKKTDMLCNSLLLYSITPQHF